MWAVYGLFNSFHKDLRHGKRDLAASVLYDGHGTVEIIAIQDSHLEICWHDPNQGRPCMLLAPAVAKLLVQLQPLIESTVKVFGMAYCRETLKALPTGVVNALVSSSVLTDQLKPTFNAVAFAAGHYPIWGKSPGPRCFPRSENRTRERSRYSESSMSISTRHCGVVRLVIVLA